MTDETPNIETIEVHRGSFSWALKELNYGKTVRRRSWKTGSSLQFFAPDILVLREVRHPRRLVNVIDWDDVLASDWTVVV